MASNFNVNIDQCEIKEKYSCAICYSIYDRPYKIENCNHVFCQLCLYNSYAQRRTCPICKTPFDYKKIKFDTQLDKKLKTHNYICNACDTQVLLSDFNNHNLVCNNENMASKSKTASGIKNNNPIQNVPNRFTFKCPFCEKNNLPLDDLREHCNTFHKNEDKAKVCPVCSSMPWGDPNQKSSNFLRHLNLRHQFEYEHFVDFCEDETVSLKKVIQKSLNQI